jgi:hypothetical protein
VKTQGEVKQRGLRKTYLANTFISELEMKNQLTEP